MNAIQCIHCENTGQPGIDMTLRRDGIVQGTRHMPRYVAICNECTRTEKVERDANEYKRAKAGAQAYPGRVA